MIDTAKLKAILDRIVQPGRGILAADESSGTIKKRLDSIGVENTEENRVGYRNTLFTAPGFAEGISGVILFDETVDQKGSTGQNFAELIAANGAVPGIKSDEGKEEHPHFAPQTITRGLKGLSKRLEDWTARSNGTLGFTKWRQVILVEPTPSDEFLSCAMDAMAQQAAYSQAAGYIPINEPEVLMDGSHTLEQCAEVTERTLKIMFEKFKEHGVDVSLTLLKPNMILSGKDLKTDTPEEVADATIATFQKALPSDLPGIVFLSGGQTPVQATENLNAVVKKATATDAPWWFSFSYGRALQEDAIKAWGGDAANVDAAQSALLHRAKMNGLAQRGKYESSMET